MAAEQRHPSSISALRTLIVQWPMKKKALILVVFLTTVLLLFFAIKTLREADYQLLYANLDPEDYIALSNWLAFRDIKFKTDQDQYSIYIPADRIHQARLDMAQQRLPGNLGNTKDLLDAKPLFFLDSIPAGDSLIAMQNELSETIAAVDHISSARVHLSLPADNHLGNGEPSATVLLTVSPGSSPSPSQLQGIIHLLAASVSGLNPGQIRVFDSSGKLLSSSDEHTAAIYPDRSLSYQAALERRLENKAQDLVDTMLGRGQALIKIAAQIDFSSKETTSELYDPEEPVLRSEHVQQEPAGVLGSASGPGLQDSTTQDSPTRRSPTVTTSSKLDYEISKTTSKTIQPIGVIEQLSVTILVADEQIVAQDGNSFFQPRSDETIESIRSLVTSALSLNPGRGDAINIIKVPNQAVQDDSPPQQISLFYEISNLIPIGKITFLSIVFLLFYFLILKPVLALLHRDIEQVSGDKEDRDEENVVKTHTEDEQIDMAAALKKEIENDPIGAAHVIKRWIQET